MSIYNWVMRNVSPILFVIGLINFTASVLSGVLLTVISQPGALQSSYHLGQISASVTISLWYLVVPWAAAGILWRADRWLADVANREIVE